MINTHIKCQIKNSIILLLGVFIYIIMGMFIINFIPNSIIATTVLNIITIFILTLWLLKNPPQWKAPKLKSPLDVNVLFTICLFILTWLISQTTAFFVFQLVESDGFREVNNQLQNTSLPILILATCIIGPIAEELFIRGFVQGTLMKIEITTPYNTIIISSLIFATLHANIIQMIIALALGFFCGTLYYHTKNIIFPIITHIGYNSLSLIIPASFIRYMVNIPTIIVLILITFAITIIFNRISFKSNHI